MLLEFVTTQRDVIITRSREKLTARPWPTATTAKLQHGVPLFLTRLSEALQQEAAGGPYSAVSIGASAPPHERELPSLGFTVSQVVYGYADICQAVTALALEQNAQITTTELLTLSRCLDAAIAETVTEHVRLTAELQSRAEAERSGQIAHEARDLLSTALLAFGALKRGSVAVNGSTAAVMARSLTRLRELVGDPADIRLTTQGPQSEPTTSAPLLNGQAIETGLQPGGRAQVHAGIWTGGAPGLPSEQQRGHRSRQRVRW